MSEMKTSEQFLEALEKEAIKFSDPKIHKLFEAFKKSEKRLNSEIKSEYSFPLADTIGKRMYELTKFSISPELIDSDK